MVVSKHLHDQPKVEMFSSMRSIRLESSGGLMVYPGAQVESLETSSSPANSKDHPYSRRSSEHQSAAKARPKSASKIQSLRLYRVLTFKASIHSVRKLSAPRSMISLTLMASKRRMAWSKKLLASQLAVSPTIWCLTARSRMLCTASSQPLQRTQDFSTSHLARSSLPSKISDIRSRGRRYRSNRRLVCLRQLSLAIPYQSTINKTVKLCVLKYCFDYQESLGRPSSIQQISLHYPTGRALDISSTKGEGRWF